MAWYDGLELRRVMEIFDDISRIPRGTGNMEGISSAICGWIRGMGLKAERDEWNNVKAWKPATPGYESVPGIMLAAHMDMVCSKNPGVKHDFLKDPIKVMLVDGDIITANGTTLGADDGMACAFILSILEDRTIRHPAIEAIFTTDEETDMNGALRMDYSAFQSRLIISLDGAPIGVACAGEIDCTESFPYATEPVRDTYRCYRLSVSGLMGGHSGMEATKERGNAAMYLNRLVLALSKRIDLQLADFVSGFGKEGRSTAFAYSADAVVAFDPDAYGRAEQILNAELALYRKELELRDPGISLSISEAPAAENALRPESKKKLHTVLLALPDGVFTQNMADRGKMDSAVNTGVVYLENGRIVLQTTIRSNLSSRKYYLYERLESLCEALDVEIVMDCDLPQWDRRVSDDVLALAEKIYPGFPVTIEEGTCECGIFSDRMPEAAAISLDTPYSGAHSTAEQISAKDCKLSYDRLVRFISELKGVLK